MPAHRVHERRGQLGLVAADVDGPRLDESHWGRNFGVQLLDVVRVGPHAIGGRKSLAQGTVDRFTFETGFDVRHWGSARGRERIRPANPAIFRDQRERWPAKTVARV